MLSRATLCMTASGVIISAPWSSILCSATFSSIGLSSFMLASEDPFCLVLHLPPGLPWAWTGPSHVTCHTTVAANYLHWQRDQYWKTFIIVLRSALAYFQSWYSLVIASGKWLIFQLIVPFFFASLKGDFSTSWFRLPSIPTTWLFQLWMYPVTIGWQGLFVLFFFFFSLWSSMAYFCTCSNKRFHEVLHKPVNSLLGVLEVYYESWLSPLHWCKTFHLINQQAVVDPMFPSCSFSSIS